MSFFDSCTDEQLRALKKAESFYKIKLQDGNPYDPRFDDTPAGKNIRTHLETEHPDIAAEFKSASAGFSKSLDAVMYSKGLKDLTPQIHEELMSADPLYRKQKLADAKAWEEKMLADMEEQAAASRERRTGKREIDQTPNFGGGWQGKSLKRQWEYDQSFKDS